MAKFFIKNEWLTGDGIVITGSDVNHIKNVLRLKEGNSISVTDESGTIYSCTIKKLNKDSVELDILDSCQDDTELSVEVTLFQGLPKAEKMELIIQKNVELGVHDIFPVNMSRCVVKLGDKAASKVERWGKISEAAAKQSKRAIIPEVKMPISFKECLSKINDYDMIILPYENALGMKHSAEVISRASGLKKVGILIGPEGGFAEEEVEAAKEAGFEIISLGKRILRTETAGFTTMSLIMFENERNN